MFLWSTLLHQCQIQVCMHTELCPDICMEGLHCGNHWVYHQDQNRMSELQKTNRLLNLWWFLRFSGYTWQNDAISFLVSNVHLAILTKCIYNYCKTFYLFKKNKFWLHTKGDLKRHTVTRWNIWTPCPVTLAFCYNGRDVPSWFKAIACIARIINSMLIGVWYSIAVQWDIECHGIRVGDNRRNSTGNTL